MKYKGYIGQVSYDNKDRMFYGEVIGLRDIISFCGKSVEELEKSFRESIDFYLDLCKKDGVRPNKSFTGNIHLRVLPDLHAYLVQEAAASGLSLNSFIIEKLKG